MVNNSVIRPCFLGGVAGIGGVPLDSHDEMARHDVLKGTASAR